MVIYIFLLALATYLGAKVDKYKFKKNEMNFLIRNKWYRSKCFGAYIILIFLVSAIVLFRYDVGTDQLYYAEIRVSNMIRGEDAAIPLGYHWLIRGMKFIISDNLLLYNTTTIIEVVILLYCFFKESKEFSLCILLFFLFGIFNVSLNISRQMLAVAVVYWGIYQYRKKKYFFSILSLVVATSFHSSMILFLLVPLIERITIKRGLKPIMFLACIAILQNQLISILQYVSKKISLLGTYYAYFNGTYFTNGFSINLFFITVAPILVFSLFNKYDKSFENINIYYNLSFMACIPGVLNYLIPNSDRFVFMFMPATCIYASQLSNRLCIKNRRLFNSIIITIGVLFFSYYILFLNCGETIPYQTWIGR